MEMRSKCGYGGANISFPTKLHTLKCGSHPRVPQPISALENVPQTGCTISKARKPQRRSMINIAEHTTSTAPRPHWITHPAAMRVHNCQPRRSRCDRASIVILIPGRQRCPPPKSFCIAGLRQSAGDLPFSIRPGPKCPLRPEAPLPIL